MARPVNSDFSAVVDTIFNQKFNYTSAEVINNSVNRQKNFFTINKGLRQGIQVYMAVTSENGVAGEIIGCSENYSIAMSLINLDFKLSARIRTNGYFGSLSWDGHDYRYAILNEIPQHVIVSIGDTIEATGYSAIFPEGTLIGTVSEFEKVGGDFYKIKVSLATDFKNLHFVEVIGSLKKKEELELENLFK
jgi:rod shape-determining protein MreC